MQTYHETEIEPEGREGFLLAADTGVAGSCVLRPATFYNKYQVC